MHSINQKSNRVRMLYVRSVSMWQTQLYTNSPNHIYRLLRDSDARKHDKRNVLCVSRYAMQAKLGKSVWKKKHTFDVAVIIGTD